MSVRAAYIVSGQSSGRGRGLGDPWTWLQSEREEKALCIVEMTSDRILNRPASRLAMPSHDRVRRRGSLFLLGMCSGWSGQRDWLTWSPRLAMGRGSCKLSRGAGGRVCSYTYASFQPGLETRSPRGEGLVLPSLTLQCCGAPTIIWRTPPREDPCGIAAAFLARPASGTSPSPH